MRFFVDIFKVLRDTTWPTAKQSWIDFISVLEYTAFFTVVIYLFDQVITRGLIQIINIF